MSSKPTFSCIIPYAGAKKYIEECINSAIKEKFNEIIIVNDGFNPNDLNQWSNIYNIKIINLKDSIGCANARNLGISFCKTKYIVFLDHDDLFGNGYLAHIISFIEKNQLRCAGGKLYYIAENSSRIGRVLTKNNSFVLPSGFIAEKNLLLEVGCFPDSYSDDLLIFREIKKVTQLAVCSDAIVLYRIHPNAETSKNTKAWMAFNKLIPFYDSGELTLKEANKIAKEYSLKGIAPERFKNIVDCEDTAILRFRARSAYACWLNNDFFGLLIHSYKILAFLPDALRIARSKWF
jgi:glycosyltransferase involved in cell wall biosynthesis